MVANIVNLLSKAIMSNNVQQKSAVSTVTNNPFASPFVTAAPQKSYAKNDPVQGGYFAGYYNGRPNIVGQRLFVSV